MPTYEYHCEKCKKDFELFQSMKDDPIATCPKDKCRQKTWGKGKVKRQLGAGAGLIFKGSGFYITDYRSEGYKQSAKNDSSSSTSPSAGGEGSKSSETKPAAKAEPKAAPKPASEAKKSKKKD